MGKGELDDEPPGLHAAAHLDFQPRLGSADDPRQDAEAGEDAKRKQDDFSASSQPQPSQTPIRPFSSPVSPDYLSSCAAMRMQEHADAQTGLESTSDTPTCLECTGGSPGSQGAVASNGVSPGPPACHYPPTQSAALHERRLQLHARHQRQHARVAAACSAVEGELLTLCGETKKKAPHVKEATERALLHIQDYRDKAEASVETLARAVSSATSFEEEAAAAEAAEAVFRAFPVKEVLRAALHAVRTNSSKISLLALSLLQRLLTSHQHQLLLVPCAPEDSLLLLPPQPSAAQLAPGEGDADAAAAERPWGAGGDEAGACSPLESPFASAGPLEASADVSGRHRAEALAALAATAACDVLLLLGVLEELLIAHPGADEHFVQLKVLQTALLLLAPDSAVVADASVAHRLLRLFLTLYCRTRPGSAASLDGVALSPGVSGASGAVASPAAGGHSTAVFHTACAAMSQLAACLVDAARRALDTETRRRPADRGRQTARERRGGGTAADELAARRSMGAEALIFAASEALRTAPRVTSVEELLAVSSAHRGAPGTPLQLVASGAPAEARERQRTAEEGEGGASSTRAEDDATNRQGEGSGGVETRAECPEDATPAAPGGPTGCTPAAVATLEQLLTQLCANCRGSASCGAPFAASRSSSLLIRSGAENPHGEAAADARDAAESVEGHEDPPLPGGELPVTGHKSSPSVQRVSSTWSTFSRPSFSAFFSSASFSGQALTRGVGEGVSRDGREGPRGRPSSQRGGAADLLVQLPRGVAVQLLENCLHRGRLLFVQHCGLMRVLKQEICPALLDLLLHHAYEFPIVVRALRLLVFLAQQYAPFLLNELCVLLPAMLRRVEADAPLWQRVVVLETLQELCSQPALLLLLHSGGSPLLQLSRRRRAASSAAAAPAPTHLQGDFERDDEDKEGSEKRAERAPGDNAEGEGSSIVTALVEALGKTVHQLCFVGSFDSQARLLSTLESVRPPALSPLILPVLLPADAVLLLLSALPRADELGASPPPPAPGLPDASSSLSPSLASREGAFFLASTSCFNLSLGRFDVAPSPLAGAACAAAVGAWAALCGAAEKGERRAETSAADLPRGEALPLPAASAAAQKSRYVRLLDRATDLATPSDLQAPNKAQNGTAAPTHQLHPSVAVGLALDGLLKVVESLYLLSFATDAEELLGRRGPRGDTRESAKEAQGRRAGAEEGEEEPIFAMDIRAADSLLLPQQQYLPLPLTGPQAACRTILGAAWGPILSALTLIFSAIATSPASSCADAASRPSPAGPEPLATSLHLLPLMQCVQNLVGLSCAFRLDPARAALLFCLSRFALPFSPEGRASSPPSSSASSGPPASGDSGAAGPYAPPLGPAASAGAPVPPTSAPSPSPALPRAAPPPLLPFWPVSPGLRLGAGCSGPPRALHPAPASSSPPSAAGSAPDDDEGLRRLPSALGASSAAAAAAARSPREDDGALVGASASLSLSCFTCLLSICGFFGNLLGPRGWGGALRALQELHAFLQARGLLGPPLALADFAAAVAAPDAETDAAEGRKDAEETDASRPTEEGEAAAEAERGIGGKQRARYPCTPPAEVVTLLEMLQQLRSWRREGASAEASGAEARAATGDYPFMRALFAHLQRRRTCDGASEASSIPPPAGRRGVTVSRSLQALALCLKVRSTAVAAAATERGTEEHCKAFFSQGASAFGAPAAGDALVPATLEALRPLEDGPGLPYASKGGETPPRGASLSSGLWLAAAPPAELSLQQLQQDVLLRLAASLGLLFDFFPLSLSDEGLDALASALGSAALQNLDLVAQPTASTPQFDASQVSQPASASRAFALPSAAGGASPNPFADAEVPLASSSSSASYLPFCSFSASYLEACWAAAEAKSEDEEIAVFPVAKLVEMCFFNINRPCFPRLCRGLVSSLVCLATASRAKPETRVEAVSALCVSLELLLPALRRRRIARMRKAEALFPSAASTSLADETTAREGGGDNSRETLPKPSRGGLPHPEYVHPDGAGQGGGGVRRGDAALPRDEERVFEARLRLRIRAYVAAWCSRGGVGGGELEDACVARAVEEEDAAAQVALLSPLCALLTSPFPGPRLRASLALYRLLTRRGDLFLAPVWELILDAVGQATELQLGGAYQRFRARLAALAREEETRDAEANDAGEVEEERGDSGRQSEGQRREICGERDARRGDQEGQEAENGGAVDEHGLGLEREMKALFTLLELLVQDFAEDVPLSPGWRTLAVSIAAFASCSRLGSSLAFRAVGFLWTLADALGRRQRKAEEAAEAPAQRIASREAPEAEAGREARKAGLSFRSAWPSPRVPSSGGVSIKSLWKDLFLLLRLLAVDARPEVRNCALRSLTSAVRTHGLSPAGPAPPSPDAAARSPTAEAQATSGGEEAARGDERRDWSWESCVLHIVVATLAEVHAAYRQVVAAAEAPAAPGADSAASAPPAVPSAGASAGAFLVHHSRDSAAKQWGETVVIAMDGALVLLLHCAAAQEAEPRSAAGLEAIAHAAFRLLERVQQALLAPDSASEILIAAAKTLADVLKLRQARVKLSSLRRLGGRLLQRGVAAGSPVPDSSPAGAASSSLFGGAPSVWSFGWEVYWRFALQLLSPASPWAQAALASAPFFSAACSPHSRRDETSLSSPGASRLLQTRETMPDRLVEVVAAKTKDLLETVFSPEKEGDLTADTHSHANGEAMGRSAAATAASERDPEVFPVVESVIAFQLFLVMLTNPAYIRRYGRRLDDASVEGLLGEARDEPMERERDSCGVSQAAAGRTRQVRGSWRHAAAGGEEENAEDAANSFEGETDEPHLGDATRRDREGQELALGLLKCEAMQAATQAASAVPLSSSLFPLLDCALEFARTVPGPALSLPLVSASSASYSSFASSSSASSRSASAGSAVSFEFDRLVASPSLQRASLAALVASLPPLFAGSGAAQRSESSTQRLAPRVVEASSSFVEAAARGHFLPLEGQADPSPFSSSPFAPSPTNPFQSEEGRGRGENAQPDAEEERERGGRFLAGQRDSMTRGSLTPSPAPPSSFSSTSSTSPAGWPPAPRVCVPPGPSPFAPEGGDGERRQAHPPEAAAPASSVVSEPPGAESRVYTDLLLLDGVRSRLGLAPFLPPPVAPVSAPESPPPWAAGAEADDALAGQAEHEEREREGGRRETSRARSPRLGAVEAELRAVLATVEEEEKARSADTPEEARERLLLFQPIVAAVRVSTAQVPLLETLVNLRPSATDAPVAFSLLVPLFLKELCETFLRPEVFFRDSASLAVGCRVLLELQIFFRASFVSLMRQDFARSKAHLAALLASLSSLSPSGRGPAPPEEPADTGENEEASGDKTSSDSPPEDGSEQVPAKRGEKEERSRREGREGSKQENGIARRGAFAKHRGPQEELLWRYATSTGMSIATPQLAYALPTSRRPRGKPRAKDTRAGEARNSTQSCAAESTREANSGAGEEAAASQAAGGRGAGSAERAETDKRGRAAESQKGPKGDKETTSQRSPHPSDEALNGMLPSPSSFAAAGCACRGRPCVGCACEHSPAAVLLLSLPRIFEFLACLAETRTSPSLKRLQAWKLALQVAFVLTEDAFAFLSRLSWRAPRATFCVGCTAGKRAREAKRHAPACDKGVVFYSAATAALRRFLRVLAMPPSASVSTTVSASLSATVSISPFAPASPFFSSAPAPPAARQGPLGEGGAALPSAFFFDRWMLRIAAETLARPAPRHAPCAPFYPFFVQILDHYCAAGSERPAIIAHEAFCTLFDLSEDLYARRKSGALFAEASLSRTADAATRARVQSVLPLVLRRCRAILQRFAAPAKPLATPECRHAKAGGRGSVSEGAPQTEAARSVAAHGRSQLVLFVLSRLRTLETSPRAFSEDSESFCGLEADADAKRADREKAQAVQAAAAKSPDSRDRFGQQGDAHAPGFPGTADDSAREAEESAEDERCASGDAAAASSEGAKKQECRTLALRAAGSKAHLLLLLPQLTACIGCDDKSVRREIQATLCSLCRELGVEEETSLDRLAARTRENREK
ncbi:hypothetical protein BESB_051530 [Besnoitia besnoiti]|uniref:Mon2/Sec7/BIG1-like HUS domain-containing protein n=1 Tax=Besnoitia besnoiti TaxID=94643 RepID=A0A2A9MJE5_BESBE|nr:hypothetical protein BESB_051530 [Besnoitia besnoiti]PFH35502.1 hypothetical protein BESB_051530 [Besnoitia besnoiti]